MIQFKICGITNPDDAQVAVENGASAIGFIFYPKSPRYIDPADARDITQRLDGSVKTVGEFVNESNERVNEIAREVNLDFVQLHGDESPEYCRKIERPVIKSFRIRNSFDLSIVKDYPVDAVLLDTYVKGTIGGTGAAFHWANYDYSTVNKPLILAGGLTPENVTDGICAVQPDAVDISSGVEISPGKKDLSKIEQLSRALAKTEELKDVFKLKSNGQPKSYHQPDSRGHFGQFGGKYVPETLIPALEELERIYLESKDDPDFQNEFQDLLSEYAGRPSLLYYASRISEETGYEIYLKREDLNHTGAHKINNTLGQILLAKKMGKSRIIAETGAGQHGVATATVAAKFGLKCIVYMGEEDVRRQNLNVFRMNLLGAEVRPVKSGSKTLKDATNEAIRDWVANVEDTYYLIGSVVGPHPYPMIVRDFQSVIGTETREQILEKTGKIPDALVACVGGGSNAIGIFHPFIDTQVKMYGVEAAGLGVDTEKHAATIGKGSIGIFHGSQSYLLQNNDGQVQLPHSISAGLDYPGIGPEHSYLQSIERVQYLNATDEEAVTAYEWLSKKEGIIPALESAHALAVIQQGKLDLEKGSTIVVNLSGRGDKDVHSVADYRGKEI